MEPNQKLQDSWEFLEKSGHIFKRYFFLIYVKFQMFQLYNAMDAMDAML